MKQTDAKVNDKARVNFVETLEGAFKAQGSEVLRVASNKLALPFVNELGNEYFLVLTVSVPKGSRDGELFDGRAEAVDYAFRLDEKAKQVEKREAEKAAKVKAKAKAKE